ncbi:MAG: insulinase family protein, partial [Gammaproteobacteria bacterium]|nr:insulinase family protein [Gammaproteobacteria bacterium]
MSSSFLPIPWRRAWLVLALLGLAAAAGAVDVIKSPHDPRSYRALTLENGLRVVLVSDPDTDKAAASLDVNVGSGSDPAGREGLAHFLEHMLFLGTAKYPDPAEYKEFISSHGGSENAYTAYDHTNYFFDVDQRHLEPALDRFAQFFIAPMFNPEYVTRERQVVHSEYASKVRSDGRRHYYAQKQAMNPRHPYARFAVGDNETLADREGDGIRDELIAFYRDHYSANLMTLAVLGSEPLDVLERWVRERFSAVPNARKEPLATSEPLFEPDRLPARLTLTPVKEKSSVTLTFPIPPVDQHVRSKPTFYIAHMLGHEGKGSLLSALKRKGLSEGLSAGLGVRHSSEATFDVSIKLTPAGVERIDEVVGYVFEYIELMRRNGVDEWMYEEQRKLADMRFLYAQKAEPRSLVRALAANLHELPARDVLRGSYALDAFEPALIEEYMAALRPDNVLVTLVAGDVATDAVTSKYGIEYRIDPIGPAAVAAWREAKPHAELALPGPNQF